MLGEFGFIILWVLVADCAVVGVLIWRKFAADRAARRNSNSAFWTAIEEYGRFHHIPQSDTAVIFVHGIDSDSVACWSRRGEHLAEQLAKTSHFDCTYFAFDYASRFAEQADINNAARLLQDILRTDQRLASCRYLIFIGHSTGGIVVKQTLVSAVSQAVLSRTRLIVHVAVPHFGGVRRLTFTLCLVVYPLLVPLFAMIGLMRKPSSKPLGINRIAFQLIWRNPWIVRLDRSWRDTCTMRVANGLPVPALYDFRAVSDGAVPETSILRVDETVFTVVGTHVTSKQPKSQLAAILDCLLQPFLAPQEKMANWVAEATSSLVAKIDREFHIKSLTTAPTPSDSDRAAVESAMLYSTAEPVGEKEGSDRLLAWLDASLVNSTALITGAARVGKSTTLRQVGRALADRIIAGATAGPLPIFFNLGAVVFEEEALRTCRHHVPLIWCKLITSWQHFASPLVKQVGATFPLAPDWVRVQLQTRKVALILDGVDEFCSRTGISLQSVGGLINYLLSEQPYDIRILLGVRGTQLGLADLRISGPVVEVLRLTRSQLQSDFPGAAKAITSFDRTIDWLQLSSAMVAGLLDRLPSTAALDRIRNIGCLFDLFLEDRARSAVTTNDIGSSELIADACMLIGWAMFAARRGEITAEEILKAIQSVQERWKGLQVCHPENRVIMRICNAAGMLADSGKCSHILARTIFYTQNGETWRLEHPTWSDFLVARYYKAAMDARFFDEFGCGDVTHKIYLLIADLSYDVTVTSAMVEGVFSKLGQPAGDLIVGAFLGLLNNLRTPIEPQAIGSLLQTRRVREIRLRAGKFLLTIGLAYRRLRLKADKSDDAAANLLEINLPPFLEDVCREINKDDNPLLIGSCACILENLKNRCGVGRGMPTDVDVSELFSRRVLRDEAIDLATGGPSIPGDLSRRIQEGLLSAVRGVRHDPDLGMTVPYLYALVCAKNASRLDHGVASELRLIFQPASPTWNALSDYVSHYVPSAKSLLNRCVREYRDSQ